MFEVHAERKHWSQHFDLHKISHRCRSPKYDGFFYIRIHKLFSGLLVKMSKSHNVAESDDKIPDSSKSMPRLNGSYPGPCPFSHQVYDSDDVSVLFMLFR